jgi:uncharacterized membrane protein
MLRRSSEASLHGPTDYLLWGMLIVYAAARLLQLASAVVPTLAIVILHVLPPAVFAILHGIRTYRLGGGLAFAGICLSTGSLFEILSLRTGFPFGHYHFTAVMGPKLFQLPVLLALAYVGMGYIAWILALLIANPIAGPRSRRRLLIVPLIASFVMVAWDLSMEPDWATVDKAWVWTNGGPYLGVPVSNFLGWYLTTYIFYQLFAIFLGNRAPLSQPPSHWRLPVLFYALSAGGNLLLAIPATTAIRMPRIVSDAAGHPWMVSDVIDTCALMSLLVMAPIALMAWVSLSKAVACGNADFAVFRAESQAE